MNVEPIAPRTVKHSIVKAICDLKPGQQLRLTTAREAFNIRSTSQYVSMKGLHISTFVDNEDIIVQVNSVNGPTAQKEGSNEHREGGSNT